MTDFKPGFRISVIDVTVLLFGIVAAIYVQRVYPLGAFIILGAVGHFFLFCNIVRMSRIPELIWAVSYTGAMACHVLNDWPSGKHVATAIFVLTGVLILLEIRKPSYHGVGWQYINPKLEAWFTDQRGQ